MAFLITTTVTLPGGQLVIPEFGDRTLVHPLVNYDLEGEFDLDEIRVSATIQTAITNGWITVVDGEGKSITNLDDLQATAESINSNNVDYTPANLIDWDTVTPNLINTGLDQLASRLRYVETHGGGGGGGIALTDLSATSPLLYDNLTGVFSIQVANTSQNGYLSSTDWNTFNNKQSALSGTGLVKSTAGTISYITDNSSNWDTAFSQRLQWDGGSTNLVAATGRTSLGATTLGSNLFTATNPSAITFIRVNADNSVSLLDAATFRTAIGAGTVTSITLSTGTTGLTGGSTITSSGTWTLAGTLVAANGGTGISSYAVGDLLYANTISTLAKLAATDTGNALISGGIDTAPSWGKIGLSTHVSGNLPVTNLNSGTSASSTTFWRGDGTWAIPASVSVADPLTTKGDIWVYSTTDARLPVGTNGQVLISDSSTVTGLKWADGSSISGATAIIFTQTATKTVGNTVTETTLTNTGTGSLTLAASSITSGTTYRVTARGYLSYTSGTLIVRFKIGGTTFAATPAAQFATATNTGFIMELLMTCYTTGSSGTVWTQGHISPMKVNKSNPDNLIAMVNTTTNTINTTISNAIDVTAQWSIANSANTVTVTNLTIQKMS